MAINSIRYRRGSVDVGAATKSCAISLLALAGSVREIPDSFFVARRPGKLSLWGTHRGGNERCVLHCSRGGQRSEEHTSELQSRLHLVCRPLLEKKKIHVGSPYGCYQYPILVSNCEIAL